MQKKILGNKEDLTMKNLKTIGLKNFSLVVLLVASATFVACSSSEDSITENLQPIKPTGMYTMSIQSTKSGGDATTRALTLTGSTLTPTWATTENVYVKKGTDWATGSLKPDANSVTANLSGKITDITIEPNEVLTLQFPKSGDISYGGQIGTLADIAANFDYATADVTVASVDNEQIRVDGTTTFQSQQAIAKFTLLDKDDNTGNTKLSPTQLYVKVDVSATALAALQAANSEQYTALSPILTANLPYENSLTIPEATYSANGDGILYLAIPDKVADIVAAYPLLINQQATIKNLLTITLTATVGTDTYVLTKTGFPFSNGKYYEITAKMKRVINLNNASANMTLNDGAVLTGTLDGSSQPYKISIADGATVTLSDVTINGVDNNLKSWAGLTCEGDATIILAEGTTNTVTGFYRYRPGIQVGPKGTTLIIKGTGQLTASSHSGGSGNAAGIGSASDGTCGNIEIQGGDITAKVGKNTGTGAGIGSSKGGTCGNITISGGKVTATGGSYSAGIGSGNNGTCGTIIISGGTVTAKGGTKAAGIGSGGCASTGKSTCGDIIISGGSVIASSSTSGTGIGTGLGTTKGKSVCGDITISGGSVNATGKTSGIGTSQSYSECGSITITSDVSSVEATRGVDTASHIGAGGSTDITCGTVTIDGVSNATTESSFEHLSSTVSGNTWTLTLKNN